MLMAHPVFVEHLRHFLGDHVTIVLNGNERDFFSRLGHGFWSGGFRGLGGSLWGLTHGKSIHHAGDEKGSYSKASRDERSGYVFWHEVQVRK
jgi:hypothetical protein